MSATEKCVRCDTRYPAIGAVLCIVCQIEVSEGVTDDQRVWRPGRRAMTSDRFEAGTRPLDDRAREK